MLGQQKSLLGDCSRIGCQRNLILAIASPQGWREAERQWVGGFLTPWGIHICLHES